MARKTTRKTTKKAAGKPAPKVPAKPRSKAPAKKRVRKQISNTQFDLGNALWKLRHRSGRRPKYATPDQLLVAVVDYFKWVDDNPFQEQKAFQYEGAPVYAEVNKMRPYTRVAMANHIGVTDECWRQWRDQRPDLLGVIQWAESCCDNQMVEGAASGFFNANIISRYLGLAERTVSERTIKVEAIQMTFVTSAADRKD